MPTTYFVTSKRQKQLAWTWSVRKPWYQCLYLSVLFIVQGERTWRRGSSLSRSGSLNKPFSSVTQCVLLADPPAVFWLLSFSKVRSLALALLLAHSCCILKSNWLENVAWFFWMAVLTFILMHFCNVLFCRTEPGEKKMSSRLYGKIFCEETFIWHLWKKMSSPCNSQEFC